MQLKIDRASLAEHKQDFRQRIRDKGNNKFDNLYPERTREESTIQVFQAFSLSQPVPPGVTALWTKVQTLRTAEDTAIASVNSSTTVQQMRNAWQTFLTTIQAI